MSLLEWKRFEQVTQHIPAGHRLYRTSAPNYPTQNLTPTAVQFLIDNGIDSIISFNESSYNAEALQLVENAKIDYIHFPVADFTGATLAQLEEANDFFLKHKTTLVHCGYGHGRTGTGVTALQLYATKGTEPPEILWDTENHVETSGQIKVLGRLRDSLLGS